MYFFVFVCLPDINDRLIRDRLDCWVEIDSVEMGSCAYFLIGGRSTLTKVVLPVPDIPITIRQVLLWDCWLIRVDIIILPLLQSRVDNAY